MKHQQAIEKRSNEDWTDALEAARDANGARDSRHHLCHIQVFHPDDIPRFADLGVIAAMQPTHATSDMYWAGQRLGPGRLAGAYAWRSLLDSGASKAAAPEVTIMGNKEIPYRLLKKVMATCTEAGFGKISLAVLQKTAQEG